MDELFLHNSDVRVFSMSRAVRIDEFDDAGVLRLEDVTTDAPVSGEVRLRVHAIDLNRTEITMRAGRSPVELALPALFGFEAVDIVEVPRGARAHLWCLTICPLRRA